MNAEIPKKTAVPFTFDRSFERDGKVAAAAPAQRRKMMSADDIEVVRKEGFDNGRREGEASAARRHADALNLLSLKLETLAGNIEQAVIPARADAVMLAYVIALKMSNILLRQHPRTEIEALVAQCVEEHKSEPHIVLRVNDALHDDIKKFADKLAETRGFLGRIHIIGEPDIVEGDCMIEWADGGLERRQSGALKEIDKILRGYLIAAGAGDAHLPDAEMILREDDGEQLTLLGAEDKRS